tara:strand:- start:3353 stop:3655 length:303 start_codon:yes stop_codon:yes gene_type:complete
MTALLGWSFAAKSAEQGVEHRFYARQATSIAGRRLGNVLQVLADSGEFAFYLQEALGLREGVTVAQSRQDEFSRNAGGRARNTLGPFSELVDVIGRQANG